MDADDRIKELHALPDYMELAKASSLHDSRSEYRNSIADYARLDLGLDPESFEQWAEQRAIRAVVIATGDLAKLDPLRAGEPLKLALTREQQTLLPLAKVAAMDGFGIGYFVGNADKNTP